MSELKITLNSLENAILKDGLFVNGHVNGNGYISADGDGAHAEGYASDGSILATGLGAHAEGYNTKATGTASHAEGWHTIAYGEGSHAEGYKSQIANIANIYGAHVEGVQTYVANIAAHAEGWTSTASGFSSHTEGIETAADKSGAHAEGGYYDEDNDEMYSGGNAFGHGAHAEGICTTASGMASHAEGKNTLATGTASHAGGVGTIANQEAMTAIGKYNDTTSNTMLFVVGNGILGTDMQPQRSNAFWITDNGEAHAANGFYDESDIRKKDILSTVSLEKSYKLLDKCQEIIYILKDDPNKKEQVGMIAQEVEDFFPEIVSTDSEGFKSLDYARLSVICLRLVKDIVELIKEIKNEIKNLKN